MPAQFGSSKIGAMQYNGFTIGEAMRDGQIVFTSRVPVTAAAPTFLTTKPWITYPDISGVVYTTTGTPYAGATVTVTASAEEGYKLTPGTTTWTHTYAPAGPIQTHNPHVWAPMTNTATINIGSGSDATSGTISLGSDSSGSYGQFRGGHLRFPVTGSWSAGGTIGGWYRDPGGSSTGHKTIMQRASLPGAANAWELYMTCDPANGRLLTGAQVNAVWWDVQIGTGLVNIVDGNWHHIAATLHRSGTSWVLTGYADNRTFTASRVANVAGNFTGASTFFLGSGRDGSVVNADIDDALMIDKPLTSAELTAIRSAGRPTP